MITENAQRVYLGTDMGNVARETEDFDTFNSRWCAKMMMLSISKKEEDTKTFEAMKEINAIDFYCDARRD